MSDTPDPYGGIPLVDTDPYGGDPLVQREAAPDATSRPLAADRLQGGFSTGDIETGNEVAMLAETGAATMRGTADLIDFLISDTANNILSLSGSSKRMGTLREALKPTGIEGGFVDTPDQRKMAEALGTGALFGLGAAPAYGRDLLKARGIAAEFAGFGSSAPARTVVGEAVENIPVPAVPRDRRVPRVQPQDVSQDTQRSLALKRQQGDVIAAGYKLDKAGNVVEDEIQQAALKSGLEKRVVAQVAQSSDADKGKIREMLDIVGDGLENKTFADFNYPRSVLGDSMYSRYQVVEEVNEQAGRAVRRESQALKDIPYDPERFMNGPFRNFYERLLDLDVTIENGKPNFSRSAFRGSPGAQEVIRKTMNDLVNFQPESMYDVHNLKIFIDDMVEEYGKSAGGLSGRAERVVKMFRHDVNDFIRQYSEGYAEANDIFSETIDVLNDADRLVGRNNAVDPRSLARTARKAVSNYATGDQVVDMLVDFDDLARKYGADFADDLKTQVSVVQTIERQFPSARPPAAFASEVEKGLKFYGDLMTGGKTDAVSKMINFAAEKFGKSSDERMADFLEAMRNLAQEPTQ